MAFPDDAVTKAWNRQNGQCAYCGKELVWENDDKGTRGAWHPHHRKADSLGGTDFLGNCAILCINEPENCHLNIGHGGNYQNNPILYDEDLPYLYEGEKQ